MWERSLRAADKSPRTIAAYLYALDKLTKIAGSRPIDSVSRAAPTPRNDEARCLSVLQPNRESGQVTPSGWLNVLVILFFWNAAKVRLAGDAESILPTRASAVERQG